MTGQALERHQESRVAPLPSEQEMRGIEFNARAIVALDSRLKGRPDAREIGFGLAVTLWNYGVPGTVVNAKKLHLIPAGKDKLDVFESAQLLLGLLTMHGHDVWFVEETDERVVLRGRRFGQGRTHEVVYDAERARKSGALDEWVQRRTKLPGDQWETTEKYTVAVDGQLVPGPFPDWVQKAVAEGRVRRNDYWFHHRIDALGNRAIRRLAKRLGADALLGMGEPADVDVPATIPVRDDDLVVDVEEGDEEPEVVEHPEESPDPAAAHRNECGRIASAMARIPDGLWRQQWAKAWREAGLPGHAHELSPEQLEPARQLIRQYISLAVLEEAGVSSTADRHAFVHVATHGGTESTQGLTAEHFHAVYTAAMAAAEARKLAHLAGYQADDEPPAEPDSPEDVEPAYGPGEEPFE